MPKILVCFKKAARILQKQLQKVVSITNSYFRYFWCFICLTFLQFSVESCIPSTIKFIAVLRVKQWFLKYLSH